MTKRFRPVQFEASVRTHDMLEAKDDVTPVSHYIEDPPTNPLPQEKTTTINKQKQTKNRTATSTPPTTVNKQAKNKTNTTKQKPNKKDHVGVKKDHVCCGVKVVVVNL